MWYCQILGQNLRFLETITTAGSTYFHFPAFSNSCLIVLSKLVSVSKIIAIVLGSVESDIAHLPMESNKAVLNFWSRSSELFVPNITRLIKLLGNSRTFEEQMGFPQVNCVVERRSDNGRKIESLVCPLCQIIVL